MEIFFWKGVGGNHCTRYQVQCTKILQKQNAGPNLNPYFEIFHSAFEIQYWRSSKYLEKLYEVQCTIIFKQQNSILIRISTLYFVHGTWYNLNSYFVLCTSYMVHCALFPLPLYLIYGADRF